VEVNVTLMVWLAPTATLTPPTDAVAETLLSEPATPLPTGAAFGGVTGAVGVPLVPVGAIVPLSLPKELEPHALKMGSDKTPRKTNRWPSSIFTHQEPSVGQTQRLAPATPLEAMARYAGG
jgi:hypothetical protein